MAHIIQKQVIELKLNKQQDAFRMQHLISEHYRNEIMPLLEAVFNDCCSEDEVIILDKLEIDFGIISEKDIEKNRWDENILATFKTNLLQKIAAIVTDKTATRQTAAINSCRQWMAYMQNGYLPWNTITLTEAWYKKVLETLAVDYAIVTTLRNIILQQPTIAYRIALQHDSAFLTTLVEILTAQNQRKLNTAVAEIYSLIKQIKTLQNKQPPAFNALIKAIWQQVLLMAATGQTNLSTETMGKLVLQPYVAEIPFQKKLQKNLLQQVVVLKETLGILFGERNEIKRNTDFSVGNETKKERKTKIAVDEFIKPNPIKKEFGQESQAEKENQYIFNGDGKKNKKTSKTTVEKGENIAKKATDTKSGTGKKQEKEPFDDPSENKPKQKKEEGENKPKIEKKQSGTAQNMMEKLSSKHQSLNQADAEITKPLVYKIPDEGIFINNAGVVLVHPFLGSLFKRLQWLENNRFVDAEHHMKAVFMVHYLATGQTTATEHSLVFCKLLCAYPLGEPLPTEIDFSATELLEATDMLTAVLQQWDKLQHTSIDGLREGFLQRNGKLFTKNGTPTVQVESSAIDILLDYLPWNLSIIKLGWMNEILRVEWR